VDLRGVLVARVLVAGAARACPGTPATGSEAHAGLLRTAAEVPFLPRRSRPADRTGGRTR
jgi:hypothetical protein